MIVTKKHLGAAGTVFTRLRVLDIMTHFNERDVRYFDWQWSEYLVNNGKTLYAFKQSYVQHIGILGQNNKGLIHHYDYGLNFLPVNEVNERIMAEFLDELVAESKAIFQKIDKSDQHYIDFIANKRWLDFYVGYWVLYIPRLIKKWIKN